MVGKWCKNAVSLRDIYLGCATIAWFAVNRSTSASTMGAKVKGKNFDLITKSSDETNKHYGAFYDPYHLAAQNGESGSYDIWLVDDGSKMNNYAAEGVDPDTLGIEPKSSGKISFYIRAYEDVTVDFTFETIGYNSRTTTESGQQQVTMTALSSQAGEPACFLNGHILLFEDYDPDTKHYSGLIKTDANGKRVFSKEFTASETEYKVDIYWVWPETLDTLVYNSNNPDAEMICDKNASTEQGETKNDYNKVVENICTYPQYYLKGYSSTTTYTEELVKGRNSMYNDADQDIGMNVGYVMLRLSADAA